MTILYTDNPFYFEDGCYTLNTLNTYKSADNKINKLISIKGNIESNLLKAVVDISSQIHTTQEKHFNKEIGGFLKHTEIGITIPIIHNSLDLDQLPKDLEEYEYIKGLCQDFFNRINNTN